MADISPKKNVTPVESFTIKRDGEGRIGLILIPPSMNALGVVIEQVLAGSASEASGIQAGDFVCSINGVDTSHMDHADVTNLFTSSGDELVIATTKFNLGAASIPSSPEIEELKMRTVGISREDPNAKWGMRFIDMGPHHGSTCGQVIVSLASDGLAGETGQLFAGDVILSVNEQDVTGAAHDDVVKMLSAAGNFLTLVVVDSAYRNGNVVFSLPR